jgi:hypothetical protein
MTKEEIDELIKRVDTIAKEDREIANTFDSAISTSDLVDYLAHTKIICGGMVMECTEICARAEDGTTWHIKKFVQPILEKCSIKQEKQPKTGKITFREFL